MHLPTHGPCPPSVNVVALQIEEMQTYVVREVLNHMQLTSNPNIVGFKEVRRAGIRRGAMGVVGVMVTMNTMQKRLRRPPTSQQGAVFICETAHTAQPGLEQTLLNSLECLLSAPAGLALITIPPFSFLQVYLTPAHLCIAMEYVAGGELFDTIVNSGTFSEDVARYFFQQLISGVAFCHSQVRQHHASKGAGTKRHQELVLSRQELTLHLPWAAAVLPAIPSPAWLALGAAALAVHD